jgi:hypothetical protein
MAFVSSSFSNRKLQGRRFTAGNVIDSVEAFTSTIDIQGFEVLTDDRYIPTGSTGNEQIPFSGSSQHGYYYTTGSTIETTAGNYDVLRYYYRHKLTRGADGGGGVYFFESGEPSSPTDLYGNNQVISNTQQTDFISNKNAAGSLGSGDAEDSAGLGVAYNAVVYSSTEADKANLGAGDKVDPANYVFDYKTGVLTFTAGNEVAGSNYVYITVNQYVGRTLKTQLNDGSLGGGGVSTFDNLTDSDTVIANISGAIDAATGSLLTAIDTDDVSEGSSNLYYTDARVKTKLSNDFVLSGSALGTDNQVVVYNGQGGVDSSTNLTFDGNTLTAATASITQNLSVGKNLTVTGDLTVQGTTTTVESTIVDIGDNIIVLNSVDVVDIDGGINVHVSSSAGGDTGSLLYDTSEGYWVAGNTTETNRIAVSEGSPATDGFSFFSGSNGVLSSIAQGDAGSFLQSDGDGTFTVSNVVDGGEY